MEQVAVQDLLDETVSNCWACGRNNGHGLQIKSFWEGEEVVCNWQPQPYHLSYPGTLSGGIIAGIIDCHCICTAIAWAYRAEGREIGSEPAIYYMTTSLQLSYPRPVALDEPLQLRAKVKEELGKRLIIACSLYSKGKECVRGEVTTRRVPTVRFQ